MMTESAWPLRWQVSPVAATQHQRRITKKVKSYDPQYLDEPKTKQNGELSHSLFLDLSVLEKKIILSLLNLHHIIVQQTRSCQL